MTSNFLFDNEGIATIDILCGRKKFIYNHTGKHHIASRSIFSAMENIPTQNLPYLTHYLIGNRRFRFIIGLNRDRYVFAPNRASKGVVVNSIVNQVQLAGGRFLERTKHLQYGEIWSPVNPALARQKVAHALRDKYPLDSEGKVFRRLKTDIASLSWQFGIWEDHLYHMINCYVLNTDLPRMEHASDNYIEGILFQEIAHLLNTQAELAMHNKKVMNKDHFMSIESIPKDKLRKCPAVNSHKDGICSRCMIVSDVTTSINNDLATAIDNHLMNNVPAKCTAISCIHLDDIEKYNLSFIDEFDHKLDKSLEVGMLMDDLPEGFSEKDCEELVSSLDHLSCAVK
jgi:hypothetical protein